MGLSLAEILNGVKNNLRNVSATTLPEGDYEDAVADSVITYSRHRPIARVAALTGNANGQYELPALFEDAISTIVEIEYPINGRPKSILDERDWYLDDVLDGKRLRFDQFGPAEGDTFWLKYTARHTMDSSGNTSIPATDREVFGFLATALICLQLATFYASKSNPNLQNAEIIEYRTRTQEWTALHNAWLGKFDKYIVTNTTGYYGSVQWQRDPYWDRRKD